MAFIKILLFYLQLYAVRANILYHSVEKNKDMTILQLDNLIVEELIHPKEGGGRKLLKHTFNYFQSLSEVRDLIEAKDIDGFSILRNITLEGPKWIKTNYDEKMLKKVYNWKTDDLKHLNASIESTYNIWNSFNFQLLSSVIDYFV